MYGGQCYNAKTKKIVMMQIDDEGRRQPVVYSGAPDLRAYALQGHYAADISEGSGESIVLMTEIVEIYITTSKIVPTML